MTKTIVYDDFDVVDIRVGTIIEAEVNNLLKKPSFVLKIDFGDKIGIKKSSAQLQSNYKISDLINKQVIAVVNFPKKQIANFISECLVLGAVNEKDVILISPEDTVMNGLKIH